MRWRFIFTLPICMYLNKDLMLTTFFLCKNPKQSFKMIQKYVHTQLVIYMEVKTIVLACILFQ